MMEQPFGIVKSGSFQNAAGENLRKRVNKTDARLVQSCCVFVVNI
jgi:hypothetical protein